MIKKQILLLLFSVLTLIPATTKPFDPIIYDPDDWISYHDEQDKQWDNDSDYEYHGGKLEESDAIR